MVVVLLLIVLWFGFPALAILWTIILSWLTGIPITDKPIENQDNQEDQ